jgi:predicted PurR-regulated permease PerM
MNEQRVSVSLSTLLTLLVVVLSTLLLWQLRGLLVVIMIAVVLAATIVPVVNWAEGFRVPRWLAVVLVYLLLFAGFIGAGSLVGPAIAEQIELLIRQFPLYIDSLRSLYEEWLIRLTVSRPAVGELFDSEALTGWLIRSSQQLLLRSYSATTGLLGGVFSLILAILIAGYMAVDSRSLIKSLVELFPRPWNTRLAAQVSPISHRMGSYIRGRILVSLVLSVAVAIGLSFLGLSQFALGLGAIAGVTNLIPFLGPILGAVPALIVALSQGGWLVLWVLILFVLAQSLETYVLDPLLVGPSVGIHPLYQLLAVLGGTQVLGLIGALIVPPWVAGTAVLIENLYLRPKSIAERRAATGNRSSRPVPSPATSQASAAVNAP